MTYTVNDGSVRDMWGDEEAEKLGHRISWKQWYDLNIDEVDGHTDLGGWAGRNIREGDKVVISDKWTLTFPLGHTDVAISISPRRYPAISKESLLTSISITGTGPGNSLVVEGEDKPIHFGIVVEPPRSYDISDADLASNPVKLNIENVDLSVRNVSYGIQQAFPSEVKISNKETVVECNSTSDDSRALVSYLYSEKGTGTISIDSSNIKLSAYAAIIYQVSLNDTSSIINLNSNLEGGGATVLEGIQDEFLLTFEMEGEKAVTNIGGDSLQFQGKGALYSGEAQYQTVIGTKVTSTLLVGGHTGCIHDGAHLNLYSKNISGSIIFNTDTGGKLSIGSEKNQPKSDLTGGFEFAEDSGKSQVFFGPDSIFNGYILDETKVALNDVTPTFTFTGEKTVWNVLTELSPAPVSSSKVSSLNLDKATVDLTAEKDTSSNATYGTLTLGTLDSTKGTFRLDVDIANKINDQIIIEDKVTGQSILSIVSSGTGDGTDSDVLVKAPVDLPEESFLLEPKEINGQKYRAIDEGARIYRLANVQNETEKDKRDWYLTPCKEGECLPVEEEPEPPEPTPDPPDPTPPDPPKPDKPSPDNPGPALPVYSPSAEAIFAMAGMGSQTAFYQGQLSDLRERLGEIRRDVRGEVREGLWASIGAQKDRIAGFSSTSFKSTVYRFNFGYDTEVSEWLIGGNFKYASANQKTKDAFFKAKGDAHSEGLNAYAVWHNEKGCYADLILSADRYHQRLNTSMLDGTGVRGTYRNWGVGVSAEVGKKSFINAQKTWFVEPQLQLAYYRIHGDNFTLSNGMKVKQGNFNSLTGRLGVALGRDIKSSEGQDKGQVYLRAGVKNEFLGKQKVYINGERFSDKLTGNRVYYGLATDWLVRKNIKVYGHIEREKGAHYTKEIEAQVGLKWQF